jgi:ubiquinone/menaquinone biosynthesis C-methylase UbiE
MSNIYDDEKFYKSYESMRKTEGNFNDVVVEKAFFNLVGDVRGKSVLELGCGNGEYLFKFIEQGAIYAEGIDSSKNMINEANKNTKNKNTKFIQSTIENYSYNLNEFDTIVSCLTLHYVKDINFIFKNIYSSLKKGGAFICIMEHPTLTATKKIDNKFEGIEWEINSYFDIGEREALWFDCVIKKYHHTIEEIFNLLLENGFIIERITEPAPTLEEVNKFNGLDKGYQRPLFLGFRVRK